MIASQTSRLHALLRQRILTAEIQPGQLLVEPEIAEEYNVSRTPARETMRLLAAEGWLQVMPRKGYFVRPLELQDVSEVMQLRIALEPMLAGEAAKRATDELSDRLSELVAEQHAEDADRLRQLDRAQRFHLLLAEASGNHRAQSLLRPLVDEISRLHHAMPRVAEHVSSPAEHQAHLDIAESVAAQDASATETLMRRHLEESRTAMFSAF